MIPRPFQIYESAEGEHFVLLKLQLAVNGIWMALALKPTIHLVLLSQMNLDRMHFIGRASLNA